jgi:hypothetical protein
MKRNIISLTLIILLLLSFSIASGAEYKKLAQTGFQFLSVETDARAAAMAGAMTTQAIGSSALFSNPACMAVMPTFFDAMVSQNNWIADIKHNAISLALKPFDGKYGVIGLSAMSVDYGEFEGTMVWGNDQGYIDTDIFEPSALMLGLGYARSLSNKFSVGGQIKYTGQQLGRSVVEVEDSLAVRKYKAFATAIDFGTLFYPGFKSFAFGMSVRNFSNEIKYEQEGFQLPLTFSIGISMNAMDFFPSLAKFQHLNVSIDAVHPRSYPEYINVGLEYVFQNILSLRYGYQSDRDERSSNFGVGLQLFGLTFDYSYTPFGIFNEVQRFTLRFSL